MALFRAIYTDPAMPTSRQRKFLKFVVHVDLRIVYLFVYLLRRCLLYFPRSLALPRSHLETERQESFTLWSFSKQSQNEALTSDDGKTVKKRRE